MNCDRKRKLGDGEQYIMALLKRLHLQQTSELYEKAPSHNKRSVPARGPSAVPARGPSGGKARGSETGGSGHVRGPRAGHGGVPGAATGNKRWRLSPIVEEEEGSAKRRRIDTEMADNLFNNLWISDSKKDNQIISDSQEDEEIMGSDKDAATGDVEATVSEADELPETFKSVNLRVGVQNGRSLEDAFIKNQLREHRLQVVLWTPPITLDTMIQNGLHTVHPAETFQNEEGEQEYMC